MARARRWRRHWTLSSLLECVRLPEKGTGCISASSSIKCPITLSIGTSGLACRETPMLYVGYAWLPPTGICHSTLATGCRMELQPSTTVIQPLSNGVHIVHVLWANILLYFLIKGFFILFYYFVVLRNSFITVERLSSSSSASLTSLS